MSTTVQSAPEIGSIAHVAPGTLLLERNIREAKPSKDLVDSIRAVGVLEPITAVTSDTGLVVRLGHRRVLAAVEAGVDTVPVYVVGPDDLSNEGEVRRVISQLDENTRRQGLTAADEVGVVEQLVAFGLTADQITKQARVGREGVDQAIAVTRSPVARQAAAEYSDLTLDQAATVAEFEDDTQLVDRLLTVAVEEPGQFPHYVQRARDDRKREALAQEAIEKLQAKGITVIERPSHAGNAKSLDYLVDDAGKILTTKDHKSCPGHVAWVTVYNIRAETDYGCADWKKYGHKDRWGGSGKIAAADMSSAEREKAKKARRLVIDNNKAWDSATEVRRAWLALLATAKTAPKGSAAFIAQAIGCDASELSASNRDTLAAEWLGTSPSTYQKSPAAATAAKVPEGRALVVALVLVLGAYEENRDRMDWRRDGTKGAHGRYLRFLESIGYTLSDVEKFAVSSRTVQ